MANQEKFIEEAQHLASGSENLPSERSQPVDGVRSPKRRRKSKKTMNPWPQYEILHKRLVDWVDEIQSKNLPVSITKLRKKALEVYRELGESYFFEAGYNWACAFEKRYKLELVHDNLEDATTEENSYRDKAGEDNDDPSQRADDTDLEVASIESDVNPELPEENINQEEIPVDCESEQDLEPRSKSNLTELKSYVETLEYKMVFSKCKRLVMESKIAEFFSNIEKKKFKESLTILINTMTSEKHLLETLLMNDNWMIFGKLSCSADIVWVCKKKNEAKNICKKCFGTFANEYEDYSCVKKEYDHVLTFDKILTSRSCSRCQKSTLRFRPAAKCPICIFDFWQGKLINQLRFAEDLQ